MSHKTHIARTGPYRWDGVPVLAYKEDGGTHFRSVTRQVLFDDGRHIDTQLRYFEVAPGGHSTLERHDHAHLVMVIRGRGQALVGREILTLGTHDIVHVPPQAWHQFRATSDDPLGFLCLVKRDRDKPCRPTADDLEALRAEKAVAAFIRV
ncbi:MAG: cupin domain-containing protein [Opitutaceae bacterium]|jgi:quercetin dioxygenase-like cupin family protein